MTSVENSASMPGTDPVIQLAAALVGRPSVTPADGGCQEVIRERLSDVGFGCEKMQFGNVTNMWARIGTGSPLLCFAGHTDVVPPGNLALWDTDPFAAVIRDGKMFGRGTADMKGSLAAMIVAGERFVRGHPRFNGSLAFLITSDEEGDATDGTQRVIETLVARGEKIDWCIVGEPTSSDRIGDCVRVGRRGSLTGALAVAGIQGHVAYAHLANNPIRLFAPALFELISTKWDAGNALFPPTSFEVVQLESGAGADNVIPDQLRARFNFRYSTEWTHSDLATKVEAVLDRHDFEYEIEWILSGAPFLTDEGRLTTVIADSIREETGLTPVFSTGGGTSDGRFIAPTGAAVVEFGPLNASIHKVNENVSLQDLVRLSAIYERCMQKLLL